MALVPAWDIRTGELLPQRVPERWFGTALGANLSRTDPKSKASPAAKAPEGRNPKEA